MHYIEIRIEPFEGKPLTTEQIIEGINNADCEQLLRDHLARVNSQIFAGHKLCCPEHWLQIVELTTQRMEEFAQRVYH